MLSRDDGRRRKNADDPCSHGLWALSAPPAPSTETLRADIEVEIAIVGAGFTGLSAALHLAEAGTEVAVLEAADIGFGGSGRNVGLVNAGLWVMPDEIAAQLGETGERLLALLGEGPGEVFDLVARHGIDCEAVRAGTLHCAVGAAGLAEIAERARQWRARGAAVRLLSAEETERKVGSRAYAGALLDERAGTIQPLAYARGLAGAAMKAGAGIHTGSPVTKAEEHGGRWVLTTPGGTLRARYVIVATNAYTNGVWPQIREELTHLPYFNLATPPLPETLRRTILPEGQGAWDTRQILSSFRLDRAGRLVFGSVGALRGPGRSVHRNWGRRALARLFPELGDIAFESQWYGQIGMTQDSLPRFHRLAPRVFSLSGYNGRGIAPGTVFGRLLAELATGRIGEGDLPVPLSVPEAVRLRRTREAYYEVGAQIAHATGARL